MTATQTADDSPMSELTVVEFESKTFGNSYVSELSDGPPYTVHGVALGADDVTVGQSGIKKKWPANELQTAADSLKGTNLVVDHENNATGVVGRVTKSGYKEETGVVYEAELYDEELAEKVQSGLLEVSIRGYHADVDSLEEDEETGAKVVEDIEFDNLSIVPTGAAPSNTLEMGEHAELSAAELSAFTDTLDEAELAEIEPGMWVEWGDQKGITISQVQDGEIEVDIYEESNGKWRSTGETTMVDTDTLSEWDVDEDEDIGAPEDEEDSESEEDEESDSDEEENAAVSEGDFVQWKGPDADPMFGQVVGIHQDGRQFKASLRLYTESGDELDETVRKPLQALDKWDGAPVPGDEDDESEEGEMPADEDSVNDVSVNDLVKVLSAFVEQNALSTKDTPTQDAEPEHEPIGADSVESLVEQFVEAKGEDATIQEFRDWLDSADLSINRGEGEEEVLDTESDLDESHEGEPHRYIDAEDEQLEERYDDYPEAAKENAQMALDAKEETGNPNDCGTDVGWKRAKQLANGEGLTREQVAKMSSFNRHRSNSEMSEEEGEADCGWMMWKAWGGDEGVDWAEDKLDSIEEEAAMDDVPPNHMFSSREEAQELADELDLNGVHEMDGQWMPGETHEEYMDKVATTGKHDSSDEESEDVGEDEMDSDEENDSEDEESDEDEEEEMASDEDMETVLGMVDNFIENNEDGEEATISDFLDWSESEPPAESVVDGFISSVEDGSKDSDIRDLLEWLNGELTDDHDEEEEASVDEGKTMKNESDAEAELQAMHEPEWDSAEDKEWNAPDLEDFTDESWEDLDGDMREQISNHFLISKTGEFPPERFSDLALPVVEPDGTLNLNALANAKARAGQVEEVSEEDEEDLNEMINQLANDNFEDATFGEEEEENARASAHDSDTAGRPTPGENTVGGVRVLSGDDLQHKSSKTGESDADSLETYNITTMTSDIEEKLSELDDPVAVEAEEVEELRNKADRFEEMSENLEALRERTDILDEVDRSQVEELAESEDPVVEESARYEELQSEAEQVKGVYAAQLAEEYAAFSPEELTDKFSIEELREKFEEQIGDVEEELASSDDAEPRSQDADEESLEEASEESDDSAEEELADEAAAKQDELKNKILGGR